MALRDIYMKAVYHVICGPHEVSTVHFLFEKEEI